MQYQKIIIAAGVLVAIAGLGYAVTVLTPSRDMSAEPETVTVTAAEEDGDTAVTEPAGGDYVFFGVGYDDDTAESSAVDEQPEEITETETAEDTTGEEAVGDTAAAEDTVEEVTEEEEAAEEESLEESAATAAPAKIEDADFSALDGETAPVIAVIIDDMGLDRKRSARSMKLPAAVTLAYLPYAADVQAQVNDARDAGHEIMVHMPMQAQSDTIDAGPDHLRIDLANGEVRRRVRKQLSAFDGYVGVNNHMGSAFTRDADKMAIVMDELRERNAFFIDSKTASDSAGLTVAKTYRLKNAGRDVFLDHEPTPDFVAKALAQAERIALRTGVAIAIGHPKDVTLDALEKWLPTLEKKGIKLVKARAAIYLRDYRREHGFESRAVPAPAKVAPVKSTAKKKQVPAAAAVPQRAAGVPGVEIFEPVVRRPAPTRPPVSVIERETDETTPDGIIWD